MLKILIILLITSSVAFFAFFDAQQAYSLATRGRITYGHDGYAAQTIVRGTIWKISHNSRMFIRDNEIRVNKKKRIIRKGDFEIKLNSETKYVAFYRHSIYSIKVAVFSSKFGRSFYRKNYLINEEIILHLKDMDETYFGNPLRVINELVIDEAYESQPEIEYLKGSRRVRRTPKYKPRPKTPIPPKAVPKPEPIYEGGAKSIDDSTLSKKRSRWAIGFETGPALSRLSNGNFNSTLGLYGAFVGTVYIVDPHFNFQLALGYIQRGFTDTIIPNVEVRSEFYVIAPRFCVEIPLGKSPVAFEGKVGMSYTSLSKSKYQKLSTTYMYSAEYNKSILGLQFGPGFLINLGQNAGDLEIALLINVSLSRALVGTRDDYEDWDFRYSTSRNNEYMILVGYRFRLNDFF